jgi:hypothetical protein
VRCTQIGLPPSGPSRDRTKSLAPSPQNGSIREFGWRLSLVRPPKPARWQFGDEAERGKSRCWQPFLAFQGKCARYPNWLAGAGGIEPPNGGIKIRCLTAWLRPNGPNGRNRRWPIPFRSDNVGLQMESCHFNGVESEFCSNRRCRPAEKRSGRKAAGQLRPERTGRRPAVPILRLPDS